VTSKLIIGMTFSRISSRLSSNDEAIDHS